MRKYCVYIHFLVFLSIFSSFGIALSEEAVPPPPPAPVYPERSYGISDISYDTLWDKIVDALKEKRLYIHPHGKTSEDKENGKLTTPTFRYFLIIQASKPVIEMDYSDQYIITVVKPPEPKKEEPKAEPAKDAKAGAAPAAEQASKDKKAVAPAEKKDEPAIEKAPPEPEAPKGPPVNKVQIQRKFLKHNGLPNPQGAWVEADPKAENNIGISEEDLFKALDTLVASAPKPTAAPAPAVAAPAAAIPAPAAK